MTSLGFIGAGNMGGALIRGWAAEQGLRLTAYDPDQERLQALARESSVQALDSAQEVVQDSDYVVLAVKPSMAGKVLQETADLFQSTQVVVSIAAGVRMERLSQAVQNACPVVRVMPNTPALIGSGVFAVCFPDSGLEEEKQEFLLGLFSSLGRVHQLQEKDMDAFTALIGSGPAYVFHFLQSLVQAGVSLGFTREQSKDMVLGLVQGSVRMAEGGQEPLAELLERVCSPAGTTIQGINHLERTAVRSAVIDAVQAAWQRSRELNG
ncbi:MAG: pyrroline-5-carboxylate reductase [Thermodesulfobacteriota bacterium]